MNDRINNSRYGSWLRLSVYWIIYRHNCVRKRRVKKCTLCVCVLVGFLLNKKSKVGQLNRIEWNSCIAQNTIWQRKLNVFPENVWKSVCLASRANMQPHNNILYPVDGVSSLVIYIRLPQSIFWLFLLHLHMPTNKRKQTSIPIVSNVLCANSHKHLYD